MLYRRFPSSLIFSSSISDFIPTQLRTNKRIDKLCRLLTAGSITASDRWVGMFGSGFILIHLPTQFFSDISRRTYVETDTQDCLG